MAIACIDMEGVLIPELWPCIARATRIDALALTTREEPDYGRLVAQRIQTLRVHGVSLAALCELVADIPPLPGAREFLASLAPRFRVILVSDAFRQMLVPLWAKLGQPELRCHQFTCDTDGYVHSAEWVRLRGKHEVIEELAARGQPTLAVGDAFNDLSMLRSATLGYLFRPSAATRHAAADVLVAEQYADILRGAADPRFD
jgi:phosphoserine / homoserine phosphotransferase